MALNVDADISVQMVKPHWRPEGLAVGRFTGACSAVGDASAGLLTATLNVPVSLRNSAMFALDHVAVWHTDTVLTATPLGLEFAAEQNTNGFTALSVVGPAGFLCGYPQAEMTSILSTLCNWRGTISVLLRATILNTAATRSVVLRAEGWMYDRATAYGWAGGFPKPGEQ